MDEGLVLLLVGALLAASVLVALGSARTGVPVLVAFLALGMLLGSDGPGGIEFDDAELARDVGIVGLVLILFEGGLADLVATAAARRGAGGAAQHGRSRRDDGSDGRRGAGAVRPHLARGVPARRRRRVHRRRGRVRDAALHPRSGAGSRARSRPSRAATTRWRSRSRSGSSPGSRARTRTGSGTSCCSSSASSDSDSCRRRLSAVAATWIFARLPRSVGAVRARGVPGGGRDLRSAPPTSWAEAASSRSTSSASRSGARRRVTVASSSGSTRASRSSRRSRCSSSSACSSSRSELTDVAALGARARTAPRLSRSARSRSGSRPHSTTSAPARRPCSAGPGLRGAVPIVLATFVLSSAGRHARTRSSTRSSSSSSSRRSSRARRSSASPRGSGVSVGCAATARGPARGRRARARSTSRLRRRARPRDRRRRGARSRSAADGDHRRRRSR